MNILEVFSQKKQTKKLTSVVRRCTRHHCSLVLPPISSLCVVRLCDNFYFCHIVRFLVVELAHKNSSSRLDLALVRIFLDIFQALRRFSFSGGDVPLDYEMSMVTSKS